MSISNMMTMDRHKKARLQWTAVNLDIREGQFISILGHNGSGKSTLAKHMNALLIPTEGTMWVGWKRYRCHGRTVGNPTDRGNGISEPG